MIYLDYNSTTPIDSRVAAEIKPFLELFFGNPSSAHSYGVKAKLAIEKARKQVANLINCDPSEIIFTSGGTESNNFALRGIAFAHKDKGNHIITSSVEHPAIIEVCKYLSRNGFEITYLPVDEYGLVNPESLSKAIRPTTILISIMHANNEVGTIQPIEELSSIAKEHNIFFHTDAAQSVGKIKTDVKSLNVDLMSIAGHKIYAPKGIGALYIKNGLVLEKLIFGADHEQNKRAGTENVAQIVGLGKACELAKDELSEQEEQNRILRDHLFNLIKSELNDIKLNGHPTKRLPNTLSISFPGIEANTLVARLDKVAVSAGAACHAETIDLSEVLKAMSVPIQYAMGTIRFSTGRGLNKTKIEEAAKEIISKVRELKPDISNIQNESKTSANNIKLTHYTHGLGCACKIQPANLEKILQSLPKLNNPNILVGTETSDDATVYKISEDVALVQTLDFFTPIVDDPYDFEPLQQQML
ncbi:MAG: IscS subfamily cysteine desulfurase [Saprospiraceae bacterium]